MNGNGKGIFSEKIIFMRDAAEVIPAITQKAMKRHAESNTKAAASSVNSRFIQT
ncbi:MAG: hypothetical protein MJZ56_04810 [Bacteroidales bacterium]|nr:hypothetical protein [Bacteroidales bacterium]